MRPVTLHAKLVDLQIALMTFRVNSWARLGWFPSRWAKARDDLRQARIYRQHLITEGHYE